MDMILASGNGVEERVLAEDFDIDIGGDNTFQITTAYSSWLGDMQIGKKIFIPGTEYGGIIKAIQSATNTDQILVKGFAWRWYLAHRFILPPAGADYYTVTGELNDIIRTLVIIPGFTVPEVSTSVSVTAYKFNRFVSVEDGLRAMLSSVGYRLDISYEQTQTGGYVQVQAVPVVNYGDEIEYSQDSMLDFVSSDDQMGVNHLICLGKGELRDRIVVHLYADRDGNISRTQTIVGINESTEVYENSGAELENLIESGTTRLKDRLNKKSFSVAIKDIEQELFIGDIVSGRDYITGNSVTRPIVRKIVKGELGVITIDYKIEGET